MRLRLLLLAALLPGRAAQPAACAPAPPGTPLDNADDIPGFCPYVWAAGLNNPRGMITVDNGDVLVLERGRAQVTVLWDADRNGVNDAWERAVLATAPGLNHAVLYDNVTRRLYASSPSTVYYWDYTPGNRSELGAPRVAVENIPTGGHVTRSLASNATGHLFVQVGSRANVDADTTHTKIHSFDAANLPADGGAFNWVDGAVFAEGLRNEVGLRFDAEGRLWGVENGVDNLNRPDLGGDIHNENPCEELNLFGAPGTFYGYPYCWSQWWIAINKSKPTGSQWAQPEFMGDGVHTDEWCESVANVRPPAYCLPAHVAPLDLLFWDVPSWPQPFSSGLFVGMHGSWNRAPPAGYQVVHVTFEQGLPVSHQRFFHARGDSDRPAGWTHRPVSLAKSRCNGFSSPDCLLITSDASGVILAMAYNG